MVGNPFFTKIRFRTQKCIFFIKNSNNFWTLKYTFFHVSGVHAAPQVNVFGASAAAAVSNPFQSQISHNNHSINSGSMVQSIRQGIANATNSSFMPPPPVPNLKKDLRRLGLEYTVADMSLSALYLHELHHRSSQNGPGPTVELDYQLNDVSEEESIPLVQNV